MTPVLEQHIVSDPDIRSGKPRIANTRLTVADIVIMHLRLGQSLPEIAGKYDVPLAAAYAALSYYYDHQQEIDQAIADDVAFAEAMRKTTPSLLQVKLYGLTDAIPDTFSS